LASYARKEFSAPISIETSLIKVDDRKVVWAEIREADKSLKPIKIKNNGKSYIRLYDGDYELSEIEEQLFVSGRGASHFDEEIIHASSVADLDGHL
jgi:ATP-dependent DNA helicase RecG